MTASTTTLRFREGSSDKQYSVSIEASGDGFVVNAAWGRTGSTMQTACKTASPVTLEKAQAAAEKLLNAKRAKGYTDDASGAAYAGTADAGRDSGLRVQLLEPVAEGQAAQLLHDSAWGMQEKFDGERRMLIIESGEVVGTNRKGLQVAVNGDLAQVVMARISVTGKTVLDGEDYGSTYAPFDLLMLNGADLRDLPYSERLAKLETLIADAPEFVRPTTYRSTADKVAQYDRLRANGCEGVVFKLLEAPYIPGRFGKSSTQFKDKFVESATVRVAGRNGDKRSVAMELLDEATGQWTGVGSCTIPANYPVPDVGALAEVGYLYAYRGGSLFQPTYKGVRHDLDESACTFAQLKYKADGPAALAA